MLLVFLNHQTFQATSPPQTLKSVAGHAKQRATASSLISQSRTFSKQAKQAGQKYSSPMFASSIALRFPSLLARLRSSVSLAFAGILVFLWGPLLKLLREQAKAQKLSHFPRRIILLRHGQSAGNVDKTLFERMPDSVIPLTDAGKVEARKAGEQLRALIGDESVCFYHSPYWRTRQTLLAVLDAFTGKQTSVSTEPRLREQDFGNFQNAAGMAQVFEDRQRFGRFFFRFPNGEAGTDVYDRVSEFQANFFRELKEQNSQVDNCVLVTHGLTMRIFCMCYFRWTVREFEQVWNPDNCELWILEKQRSGRYRLSGRWQDEKMQSLKFGEKQKQPIPLHMQEPLNRREVVPGSPGFATDVKLAHLRAAAIFPLGRLNQDSEKGSEVCSDKPGA